MQNETVNVNFDIRKIAPPKWYYIFLPWKWAHFFIYKERKLNPVFTLENPKSFSDHKCGDKMEKKWCMCIELKGVARDGFSTCMICGGKDAYGKSIDRGTKYQKNIAQQHPENTPDARDADYRG